MQTDGFEWDDNKAASNFVKHRVSFEDATFAFDDSDGFDELDAGAAYGEQRFKWIGWDGHSLLAVIYTDRGTRRRIISAREADNDEQSEYEKRR